MQREDSGQAGKVIVYVDEDIEPLIPEFLENRWQDIEIITKALSCADYETIERRGHSMKGCGGGYGFHDVTVIGSSIEIAAKNQDARAVVKWLAELEYLLKHVEVVYQ